MASRPAQAPTAQAPTATQQRPTPTETAAPAPVTTEVPKLTSIGYKIDEIEGQEVNKWFKEEFGAKSKIELQPKFKSSRGFIKGKLVINVNPEHHSKRLLSRNRRRARNPDHNRRKGKSLQAQAEGTLRPVRHGPPPNWRELDQPLRISLDPEIRLHTQRRVCYHTRSFVPPKIHKQPLGQIPLRTGHQTTRRCQG